MKIKKNKMTKLNIRLSMELCDAVITKYVDEMETPKFQEQYTHDTAFVKGAIWMRERIANLIDEKGLVITSIRQ